MKIDWLKVREGVKRFGIPLLRIVSLGLAGKKAGRVTDLAADVAEVAVEASEKRSAEVVLPKAEAIIKEGKDLLKK